MTNKEYQKEYHRKNRDKIIVRMKEEWDVLIEKEEKEKEKWENN
jgi:hypothetical protein